MRYKYCVFESPDQIYFHYHGKDGEECVNLDAPIILGRLQILLDMERDDHVKIYKDFKEAGAIVNEEETTEEEYNKAVANSPSPEDTEELRKMILQ